MALKYRVKYALSLSLKVPIFYGHRIFCLKISAPCAFHCLYASVHLTPRNAFLEIASYHPISKVFKAFFNC